MSLKGWWSTRHGARVAGIATLLVAITVVELLIRGGAINRFIVPLPTEILGAIPRVVVEENVLHRFWQTMLEIVWASVLLAVVGIPLGVVLHRVRMLRLACETWVAAFAAAPLYLSLQSAQSAFVFISHVSSDTAITPAVRILRA